MFQQVNAKKKDPQVAKNQEMEVSSSGKAEFALGLECKFRGSKA